MAAVSIDHLISISALADGKHDFKGGFGPEADVDSFNQGVLDAVRVEDVGEEHATLNSAGDVTSGAGGTIKGITQRTDAFGVLGTVTSKTGKVFNVSRVALPADNGKAIADEIGLDNTALVIDTSSHSFFGKLMSGAQAKGTTVYYCYTSESENDPAGKTSTDDPHFKNSTAGVTIIPLLQTSSSSITYVGGFPHTAGEPRKNFYSKLTFTLSDIRTVFTLKGRKKTVSISVSNENGQMIQEHPDAKTSNAIPWIRKNILAKILGSHKPKDVYDKNAAWGKKRGGDWFQVLSCLDLHRRQFNGQPFPPAIKKVFFLTYDQIALSYALMMGVNVIFFQFVPEGEPTKSCVVFDQSPRSAEEIAAAMASEEEGCARVLAGEAGKVGELTRFVTDMAGAREAALAGCITALQAYPLNGSTQAILNAQLEGLFMGALRYAHTFLEFAPTVLATRDALVGGGSACKQLSAYLSAVALNKTHRGVPGITNAFNILFERRDEVRSLKSWITMFRRGKFTKRVMALMSTAGVASGNTKDVTSFLGYISQITNAEGQIVKETIKKEVTGLLGRLDSIAGLPDDYKNGIQQLHDHICILVSPTSPPQDEDDPAMASDAISRAIADAREAVNEPDTSEGPGADEPMDGGGYKMRGGWEQGSRFESVTTAFPSTNTIYPIATFKLAGLAGSDIELLHTDDDEPTSGGGRRRTSGFDPYFAVFMMLEALSIHVDTGIENSPDLYLYERLYRFMKASIPEIEKNPAIGHAMVDVLFTMVQTETGRPVVEECLGSDSAFSLLCAALSGYICGTFVDVNEEPGVARLKTPEIATVLKSLYAGSSAGEKIDIDNMNALLLQKLIVTPRPPTVEPPAALLGLQPAPPKEEPPAVLLLLRKESEATLSGESTPAGETLDGGRRRTRRNSQSFLPYHRHRTHHAI